MRMRWLLALAAAALAGGCNCGHKGGGGSTNGGSCNGSGLCAVDGLPQATPNPLDFGTVGTGTTHKLGLSLSNQGSGPLTVESAAVSGDPSFTLAAFSKVVLQPADAITVAVTFTPQTDGTHTAQITFQTDSNEKPSYVAQLTGIAFSYEVSVSPAELDFGEQQVGTASTPQTVTVTNNSSAQETISVGPLAQGSSSDFQFTPSTAQTVSAGGSFTVSVTFAPTNTGPETATLPVSACSGCTPVNVALTGTGTNTQVVLLDNDTGSPFVGFGPVAQGQTVTAHVIAVAQSSPQAVQNPLAATIVASPKCNAAAPGPCLEQGTAGFEVAETDQSFNPGSWPGSLTPTNPAGGAGSIAYFVVNYTPPAGVASASDVVAVSYTVGSLTGAANVQTAEFPVSAGAAGNPCQQVVANPPSVAFGTVAGGTTATKTVTLTNNGPSICQLQGIGINPNDAFNEFGLVGGTVAVYSLGPGASLPVQVTFTPNIKTPPLLRKADLSMTTNDPTVSSIQVPLTGTLQNQSYAASAWPKWHHDNANTGLSGADTSGSQGQVAWQVAIGKPPTGTNEPGSYIHSPAIGTDANGDDIVYMLGYNNWQPSPAPGKPGSGNGLFYAVYGTKSASAGATLWATPMTGPEALAQESTPTIVADNSIFLMTGGEQSYYPQFFHFDPNGNILWSGVQAIGGQTFPCNFDPTGATDCSLVSTNPKVNDGFDTCPGFDSNGILYLFDDDQPGCDSYSSVSAGQPALQWSATCNTPVNSGDNGPHIESFSAALTDTSESVFSWGGMAVAVSASGSELWGTLITGTLPMTTGWAAKGASSPTCENDSEGSPALDGTGTDAVVAFGGYDPTCTSINGGIVGLNLATGKQDWGYQFPTLPPPPAPWTKTRYGSAIVAYSSPASLGNGSWVMGYLDGLYAFAPPAGGTGAATKLWQVPTGLVLSSPAVGADGTVFFGSTDGNFYAVYGLGSQAGTIKWTLHVGAAVNSSPAIGSDGTVYFAADDGNLYAVK